MKQLVLKSGKYLFFFVILQFITFSCRKDQNTIIPYVPVSLTINLVINNDLTIPGNSMLFQGFGYGGIVVYCEVPGSYYAFDAACTYEVNNTCVVKNEGVLGTCPCCGSQFIFLSGAYPSKGPAEMPLKQYNVSQLNSTTLRVYN
jgi:nitrite reductase/ring-hydroxylating ferredoxin subunit